MPALYSYILLPQNYIAEAILIGIIIVNPYILKLIIPQIEIDYFLIESHKTLYRSLISIEKHSSLIINIDPLKLTYYLKKSQILQQAGGTKTIISLIKYGQVFNSSKNITFYVKQFIQVLQNNYKRRIIIQYGYNIIQLAYNHNLSSYIIDIKASQYLNYINSQINSENLDSLQEIMGFILHDIKYKQNNGICSTQVLYSGFRDLDKLTRGLPHGDLIIIAGRPSMGKTSFVMNITYNLLKYFSSEICLFSLEMTRKQILQKLLSIGSGICLQELKFNQINIKDWHKIQNICSELLIAKIYINDNPSISINEIEYITNIICPINTNTQVIIIDYLQLLNENNFNIDNRNQELSYITRKLKILAQTLRAPVIVLSQLNRSIEKRVNKEPLLSDLKESGCISYKTLSENKNNNSIHIKTIGQNIGNLNLLSFLNEHKKVNFNSKNNTKDKNKVYILNQYIFEYKNISNGFLPTLITHNHLCLHYSYWIKQNNIEQNQTSLQSVCKIIPKVEKQYITKIEFTNYSIVYDISKYEYCNFTCNKIILHNSIEQDADIIMMLYKDSISKDYLNNSGLNILDIVVSKNRNGPTGKLQLYFHPQTTVFTNTDNLVSIDYS